MSFLNLFEAIIVIMVHLKCCSTTSIPQDDLKEHNVKKTFGFLQGPDVGQPLSYYLRSGSIIDFDTKALISPPALSMPMMSMPMNPPPIARGLASMSMPMMSMPIVNDDGTYGYYYTPAI